MNKLFKSISLITLTLILTLGLFGCGKKSVSNLNSNNNQNQNVNVATSTAATSTSDIDMSNWKTYKNEEYGFELKYPEDWFIDSCNSYNILIILSNNNIKCDSNLNESLVSIEFNKQYSNQKYKFKENYLERNDKMIKQISADIPLENSEGQIIKGQYLKVIYTIFSVSNKDLFVSFHKGYGIDSINILDQYIKKYNSIVNSFLIKN